ncbi:MAG TPA: YdeI/OmpD-associated family protein [Bryobacteraceae bacterium]|nr:YdeI/OmpD-associated family protein [Bryobacteraceae bacterium]
MVTRFAFTVPLVKLSQGASSVYAIEIPADVTAAIGRRGPVPILATLNEAGEIQASLVPMGGGRHRLQLNARTRGELEIEPGDPVRVALVVPEKPPVNPWPSDLARALKEVDLQETFAGFPAGKQNHIVLWIEEAARSQTREKRIAKAIEVTFRARERVFERRSGKGPWG